jgi:hypothetical protein
LREKGEVAPGDCLRTISRSDDIERSAAAAAVAGAAAASTATAYRITGSDSESGSWSCFDIFHFDGAAGIEQALFNQEFESIVIIHLIVIFWLIQSQAQ